MLIAIGGMRNIGPRQPILLRIYQRYLEGQDTVVFIRAVLSRYTSGALERLAGHPQREVRRAAVLSLGGLLATTRSITP